MAPMHRVEATESVTIVTMLTLCATA